MERSSFLELQGHMRSLCFQLETANVQHSRPCDGYIGPCGGQTLMLRDSQQAVISESSQNECSDSQVSQKDPSPEVSVTASRLNQFHSLRPDDMKRPYALNIDFTRSLCEYDCNCVCHQMARMKSPSYLNAIFGWLLIGYSAQPWSLRLCDNPDCQRRLRSVSYTYAFPRWLLNRMITLRIAYDQSRGPELCIRLVRVRPDDADIFYAAWTDTEEVAIQEIQQLLKHGEASVLDVDQNGLNALQVRTKPCSAHNSRMIL